MRFLKAGLAGLVILASLSTGCVNLGSKSGAELTPAGLALSHSKGDKKYTLLEGNPLKKGNYHLIIEDRDHGNLTGNRRDIVCKYVGENFSYDVDLFEGNSLSRHYRIDCSNAGSYFDVKTKVTYSDGRIENKDSFPKELQKKGAMFITAGRYFK